MLKRINGFLTYLYGTNCFEIRAIWHMIVVTDRNKLVCRSIYIYIKFYDINIIPFLVRVSLFASTAKLQYLHKPVRNELRSFLSSPSIFFQRPHGHVNAQSNQNVPQANQVLTWCSLLHISAPVEAPCRKARRRCPIPPKKRKSKKVLGR